MHATSYMTNTFCLELIIFTLQLKNFFFFNQIVAYEYKSEFGQAKAAMNAYLQSYPDDEVALREYEFLKTRK